MLKLKKVLLIRVLYRAFNRGPPTIPSNFSEEFFLVVLECFLDTFKMINHDKFGFGNHKSANDHGSRVSSLYVDVKFMSKCAKHYP